MLAIKTDKLTKTYKKSHLGKTTFTRGIEDVSFEIKRGEIFGLLGLNGSGKTTTIKLILGLLRPTSGGVSVLEKNVPSNDALRQIGYLPEAPYFYRYLTAKEIMMFYAKLSGVGSAEKRAEEVLYRVGLEKWKNKKISELSKGMAQRIGIAQSLVHDPEILIYDEPVSGLDPLAVQEMRGMILNLKAKGKTVFLSSHLISEVEKVCDRVGILVKGKLVRIVEQKEWKEKEGTLEDIFVALVSDSVEFGRISI
jgi:ABC-2 type transport system ATP-binding protein